MKKSYIDKFLIYQVSYLKVTKLREIEFKIRLITSLFLENVLYPKKFKIMTWIENLTRIYKRDTIIWGKKLLLL